ncbi:MAG TPA: HD domain-containing protein [Thermotogota bacterium]|nr:HD domain-containing protein [Thermotogota bacterium]
MLKEISLVDIAKDIAMSVHAGQYRKSSNAPYYIHPFRTYQIAKEMGLNKDQQILALLHDTYEDGKNKDKILNAIKSKFGDKMVALVKLLSHEKDTDYQIYLYKLAKLSLTAFEVKLCDMLDNLTDSPSQKQKIKYKNAVQYLLQNGINIKQSFIVKLNYAVK